jgi:5'-nucleotidase
MNITDPTADEVVVFGQGEQRAPPNLRFIHYNDVYHVDPSSAEPVGGVARFMAVCKQYKEDAKFKGQAEVLTVFSGDAFNPSLESSVTKGALACIT